MTAKYTRMNRRFFAANVNKCVLLSTFRCQLIRFDNIRVRQFIGDFSNYYVCVGLSQWRRERKI